MRRWFVVLVVLAVISAACAGDSGGSPATEAPTTSGVTVATPGLVGPSTTVPAETSTTVAAPAWPAVEVLVTNDDGVFLIDARGEISQLVKGRVAYAVDDTRGGLLFQVERGRSSGWWGDGSAIKDTRVWWVPAGSAAAQELLVPTPGEPHDLSLYDAFDGEDGAFNVLYVRHESPSDPGLDRFRFGFSDELRTYSVATGSVDQLMAYPGFEAGLYNASCVEDVVAVTFAGQLWSDCGFFDPISGDRVVIAGAPVPEPGCEADCRSGCIVSGEWLAYTLSGQTLVIDVTTGAEHLSCEGRLVDLSDAYALVEVEESMLIVSMEDPSEATTVPLAGAAKLVKAAVRIEGPIAPPTPRAIQLRADGLGVADFGDPVDDVIVALVAVLGEPSMDATHTGPMLRDENGWPPPDDADPSDLDESYVDIGCFAGTGYPCNSYFRMVEWEGTGLALMFSDIDPATGMVTTPPVFNGWYVAEPKSGSALLTTVDGIGIGSTFGELADSFGPDVGSEIGYDDVIGAWGFGAPTDCGYT